MYNSKQNTIHVPFVFKSSAKMAEEKALLDSRATHNFMNKKMAKRLGIGTRKLKTPQLIKNVDGTENQEGTLTHYTNLELTSNNQTDI
jgi:predicted aspartyl protease